MNTRSTLSLPFGLAAFALSGVLLFQPAEAGAAGASLVPAAAQEEEFKDLQAYEIAVSAACDKYDTRTIEKLLKDHLDWGQRTAVARVENIAWRPNERVIEQMKPFRTAWKSAYGNDFLNKLEKGLVRMPAAMRKQRAQLISDYLESYSIFLTLDAKKPDKQRNADMQAIGVELETIGDSLLSVNSFYYSSMAHYWAAVANNETRVGESQDVQLVARCLKKVVDARERVDFEDERMTWVRDTLKALEAVGVDPTAAAGEGVAAVYQFGKAVTFNGVFRALEEPTEIPRPGFSADNAYITWVPLNLTRIGSKATFPSMANSPEVTRTKDAEIEVKGTDGTTSLHPVTGRITLVETTAGDPPHPFAFLFQVGNNQDFFHDVQVNMQPNADYMGLYSLPVAGMTFEVDEIPVTVFDDNADGVFGTLAPPTYNYNGLSKNEYQPDIDTVHIGKAKRAVPFSEFLQVGETWYRFEPLAGGTGFRLSPIENMTTGELVLRFDGPKPEWMILRGEGNLENCYFDLTQARKLEVPVGRYSLYYGGFREGERSDGIRKAIVIPGKSQKFWPVTEDEETDVELGEPFDIDFDFTANDANVTVLGQTLTVTGKSGERYHRLWNLRLAPEVQIRKAGKGKGSKGGRMQLITDQNTLGDKGYDKGWKPQNLEVENRFGTEQVEVRLVEKKNKLFGKIESSWRSGQ